MGSATWGMGERARTLLLLLGGLLLPLLLWLFDDDEEEEEEDAAVPLRLIPPVNPPPLTGDLIGVPIANTVATPTTPTGFEGSLVYDEDFRAMTQL